MSSCKISSAAQVTYKTTSSQMQDIISLMTQAKSNLMCGISTAEAKKQISGLVQTGRKVMTPTDTRQPAVGWLLVAHRAKKA